MKRLFAFLLTLVFILGIGPAYGAEKKAIRKGNKAATAQEINSKDTTYHALIIGNNQYKYLPKLKTARNDAVEVEKLLKEKFTFQTEILLDASRADILGRINQIRKRLGEKDSLLIYYAGHGEYDKTVDKAYWLPIDAQRDDPTNWIIADDITSNIKRIAARHVLIVSDSCFSGTLGRQAITELITTGGREGYLKKMQERPSRTLMASGGNEPVSDSGGGNNSVFAAAFLKALKESDKAQFTAEEVFHTRIKEIVAGKSDQVPEYGNIKNSGHEGGDFIFQLARMEVEPLKTETGIKVPSQVDPDSGKPPKADSFSIADLEKKASADSSSWDKNLKNMKIAFGDIEKFEKGGGTPDLKIAAWQRFLETYQQKNPYSDEDNRYREKAKKQIQHWQEEKETLTKKPAVSTAMALRPSQTPKGSLKRITNSIGMEFVLIPAGSFMMGSPSDEPGRDGYETQHRVTISRPYHLQTTEVTQRQWKAIMGDNPSRSPNCGENCPVEQVSWNDAQEFIKKLNQKESTSKYRLPTEAEWEYAGRAGTTTPFHTGNCISTDQANYNGNYPLPGCSKGEYRYGMVRVKSFEPNAFGLYDMHGNVWEWCQDGYGDYPSGPVTDPTGPLSGGFRVLRGGSWFDNSGLIRTASRYKNDPVYRSYDTGFRVARDF